MPEVVELREVTDRRDVIHRAVQRLSSGELVGLPSEAGYVLTGAALVDTAARRFHAGTEAAVLLLRSAEEVGDFLPHLPPVGRRIAKRCWPGPLVLRAPATCENGFIAALPECSQAAVVVNGQMAVRVSSHPILSEVAKLTRGPLLIREIEAPTKCNDFTAVPWTEAALIVKEGEANNSNLSDAKNTDDHRTSIVQVTPPRDWTAERIGATSESKLEVAACELFLFCCTGNTCRSPMAEALYRHLLAERLQCSLADLTKRGFLIASAGLAADYGCPASQESVEVLRRRGVDLRSHSSQPLTDRLIQQADRCYTMTNSHRRTILDSHPELSDCVQLLARDGQDISDPIGGGLDDYAACAANIEKHLRQILDEIL